MGDASDKIGAEQFGPQCGLPKRQKAAGKIYRRSLGEFIGIGLSGCG
jgi:hypothetical protein